MLPEQPQAIKIAILYHQKDDYIFDSLSDHLAFLRRKGLIEQWDEPSAGSYSKEQIQIHVNEAKVIIPLESSSFHKEGNYYASSEMLSLIDARAKKGVKVWPIRIKPITGSIFEEYEVFFGEKEKPLTSWSPQEEGFQAATEKMRREIVQMLSEEWIQYGDTRYHQNCLSDAFTAYNKSLEYSSHYPPALLGKLRVFLKQDKPEEAERCFQDISSIYKQNSPYAYVKGYALLELGRLFEAQKAFQEIYQQIASPAKTSEQNVCAEAYCGEGDVYLKLATPPSSNSENYCNQALTAYSNAGKFSSGYPKYLIRIGKTYIALGKLSQSDDYNKKALDIYAQVILDYPDDIPALIGKGDALCGLRRFEDALNIYDKARNIDKDDVRIYASAGHALLKLGRYHEALSSFEKVLRFDKKNEYYLHSKGQAQVGLGRYQIALETYQEAINCDYTQPDIFIEKAEALLNLARAEHMSGYHARAEKHYIEAHESFNRAGEQGWREYFVQYYGLARAFFGLKDWANALFWYEKCITLKPDNANAHLGMGKTLVELGRYTDAWNHLALARSHYRNAELAMEEADVINTRGNAYYLAAGKPNSEKYYEYQELAHKYYKEAIDIGPNAESFIGLGKASMALNRYEAAVDAFNRALDHNPQIVECWFLKGQCYYKSGKYSEASSEYKSVMNANVDSISVYYDLGNALLAMNNYYDAIKEFDEEISRAGTNIVHAYCGKGTALQASENIKEALLAFDQANELDSLVCSDPRYEYKQTLEKIEFSIEKLLQVNRQDASLYRHKGDVLRLLGEQSEDVIDAYTLAIEYGDTSANVYYYRGRAYYALRYYESASDDYEEALRLDPNHQKAQQGKKEVASMIGPKQKSRFEKFLKFLK